MFESKDNDRSASKTGWILTLSLGLAACTAPFSQPDVASPSASVSAIPSPSGAAVSTRTVTNINITSEPTPTPQVSSSASITPASGSSDENPAPQTSSQPSSSPHPSVSPTPVTTPTPTPPPTRRPSSSGGSGSTATPRPVPVTVSDVAITDPASHSLNRGKTLDLFAIVSYSNHATSQSVTWSSDDPDTASVDNDGLVTAHKAGSVTITATSSENVSKQAALSLSIVNPVVRFGGNIVYVANNDLYLMRDSNASPVRLTQNGDTQQKLYPRLSWEGERLVYATPGNALYSLGLSGSEPPVDLGLAPNGTAPVPFIVFSGELVFQAFGGGYGNSYRNWLKLNTGQVVPYSNSIPNIAFFGGVDWEGYLFIELGGHIYKILTTGPSNITDMGVGSHPKIPLSAFSYQFVYDTSGDIYRSDYAGNKLNLTQSDGVTDTEPAISPGNERIVFVSNREGNQDLYLMDADGSNLINLTNTPDINESMPEWGP